MRVSFLRTVRTWLDRSRLGSLLVMDGVITPAQLRQALSTQKQSTLSLGDLLIEAGLVSRPRLAYALARQTVLRAAAVALIAVLSMGMGAGKTARADTSLTAAFQYASLTAHPDILGSAEKRSGNLSAFTKWSGALSRFEQQLREGGNGARAWQNRLETLRGGNQPSLRQLADRVNDSMNEKPYILDNRNWGRSDYWATPVEFMNKGGDCEDYAIAKYAALRTLGVPESRLRVAIVQDTLKNIPHAVLVVYTEEGPYILDNQIKSLVDASGSGRYRPIFSINRSAWWLHTAGAPETRLASR